jgi:hypothetical protein
MQECECIQKLHNLEIFYFNIKNILKIYEKCKSKGIPLQAWKGPEGSRNFRLPDFKTIGT